MVRKKGSGRGGWRPGAGRKPLPKAERRSKRVVVALTEAEFASLEGIASREGYETGAFAYGVIAEYLERHT